MTRLYLDEDTIRHGLVEALRTRGIDVLTPLDAGMISSTDEAQLEYATSLGRALYTFNMGDFCQLHSEWIAAGKRHAGIIVARQQRYSVGDQLRRLLKLTGTISADAMWDRLEFLSEWD